MAGRIVVGVDGSQGSRRALGWAAAEAVAREAVLQAVIVWPSPAGHGVPRRAPDDGDHLAESARERLDQLLADVPVRAPATEPLVVSGDPARVLCERSADADLLVVGSRGHGGFAGLALGSVSATCAHHSRCPLVVVRDGEEGDDDSLVSRIVVGTDGSEGSRLALAWAVREAALRGASVEALQVWRDPYGGEMSMELDMERFREDRQVELGQAEERLAAAVAEAVAGQPGIDVAPVILQGDDPARILCEQSADTDLLVVGSRGHGSVARVLLGSVGTACAHHSKCPVAIIPKGRRPDVPPEREPGTGQRAEQPPMASPGPVRTSGQP
jgi:nucleotide-binding universal stress UspA family protein